MLSTKLRLESFSLTFSFSLFSIFLIYPYVDNGIFKRHLFSFVFKAIDSSNFSIKAPTTKASDKPRIG